MKLFLIKKQNIWREIYSSPLQDLVHSYMKKAWQRLTFKISLKEDLLNKTSSMQINKPVCYKTSMSATSRVENKMNAL